MSLNNGKDDMEYGRICRLWIGEIGFWRTGRIAANPTMYRYLAKHPELSDSACAAALKDLIGRYLSPGQIAAARVDTRSLTRYAEAVEAFKNNDDSPEIADVVAIKAESEAE
jgi:hypothetical protein